MRARIDLAQCPTPVERLERLSRREGIDLWVKRDDLTGLGLSGNKVRKLEFLLAEAVEQGVDTVITTGGLQSNHCRATAVACRRLGLHPVLLLRGERPDVADANLLLDQLLGADVHTCSADEYTHHRDERMARIAAQLRDQGKHPMIIPEGGSNALGTQGYIRAAQELSEQVDAPFDAIVVAVGSGGTLAGLALGPDNGPLIGMAVCDDAAYFTDRVQGYVEQAQALGLGVSPSERPDWRVVDAYKGPAYAVAQPELWPVIADVAQTEGLFLDPVYTGKAMLGLLTEVREARLGGRILFWHTGGAFGLFGRGTELPR